MTFAYNNTLTGVGYLDGETVTCNVVSPAYIPDRAHTTTTALGTVIATGDAVAEVTVGGQVVVRIPDDTLIINLSGATSVGGFVFSDPDDRLLAWFPAEPGVPADPLTLSFPNGVIVVDNP